jgi:hypothetical protein
MCGLTTHRRRAPQLQWPGAISSDRYPVAQFPILRRLQEIAATNPFFLAVLPAHDLHLLARLPLELTASAPPGSLVPSTF